MAKQLQFRRGTTIQNDAFIGGEGEITMDTDKKQLRVHDGQTQGGVGVIDPIVAFQKPTAENGYTWYRKYASGWVEQGGQFGGDGAGSITKTLPIEMADINYEVIVSANVSDGTFFGTAYKNSTTQITIWTTNYLGGMNRQAGSHWRVSGMAA